MQAGFKLIVLLIVLSGVLAACNTMEGIGQDIKGAGRSLENAANDNK